MLQGVVMLSLIAVLTEPVRPTPNEDLRGTWTLIAERCCVDRCDGMSTWNSGKGPKLVITEDSLTLLRGKKKVVYSIRAGTRQGDWLLTLSEPVGLSAADAPARLTGSLDGDILKLCRVPDVDQAENSASNSVPLIPGLPPYQIITVHPYWKHVQFLAKRSKP